MKTDEPVNKTNGRSSGSPTRWQKVARGRENYLRFAAFAEDGRAAPLQPYMGMLGHAAVRRSDVSVFAHLHPAGSF